MLMIFSSLSDLYTHRCRRIRDARIPRGCAAERPIFNQNLVFSGIFGDYFGKNPVSSGFLRLLGIFGKPLRNTKSWSGDHGIDPKLVPGVLFCNWKIAEKNPSIVDIAPTILHQFGIPKPKYQDGKILDLINPGGESVAEKRD